MATPAEQIQAAPPIRRATAPSPGDAAQVSPSPAPIRRQREDTGRREVEEKGSPPRRKQVKRTKPERDSKGQFVAATTTVTKPAPTRRAEPVSRAKVEKRADQAASGEKGETSAVVRPIDIRAAQASADPILEQFITERQKRALTPRDTTVLVGPNKTERITAFDFNRLSSNDRKVLKQVGVDAFNRIVTQRRKVIREELLSSIVVPTMTPEGLVDTIQLSVFRRPGAAQAQARPVSDNREAANRERIAVEVKQRVSKDEYLQTLRNLRWDDVYEKEIVQNPQTDKDIEDFIKWKAQIETERTLQALKLGAFPIASAPILQVLLNTPARRPLLAAIRAKTRAQDAVVTKLGQVVAGSKAGAAQSGERLRAAVSELILGQKVLLLDESAAGAARTKVKVAVKERPGEAKKVEDPKAKKSRKAGERTFKGSSRDDIDSLFKELNKAKNREAVRRLFEEFPSKTPSKVPLVSPEQIRERITEARRSFTDRHTSPGAQRNERIARARARAAARKAKELKRQRKQPSPAEVEARTARATRLSPAEVEALQVRTAVQADKKALTKTKVSEKTATVVATATDTKKAMDTKRDPKTGRFVKVTAAGEDISPLDQPAPTPTPDPVKDPVPGLGPSPGGGPSPGRTTEFKEKVKPTPTPTRPRTPSDPINRSSRRIRVPGFPSGEQRRRERLRGKFPLVVTFQQGLFRHKFNLKTGDDEILGRAKDPTRKPGKTLRVVETTSEPFTKKDNQLGLFVAKILGDRIFHRRDRALADRTFRSSGSRP